MAKRVNTPFVAVLAAVCFVGFLAVIALPALKNTFFTRPVEEVVKEQRKLAQKLVSQGRYGEARDAITTAFLMDKTNKEVCLERGDILMLMTDEEGHQTVDAARATWETALSIDSHYKPALTRLLDSYVDQMEIAPSAQMCGHLADTADRILKFDPADSRARMYLHIAKIHEWVLGKARTPAEVEATFAKLRGLLKEDPSNAEVLFYMVRGKVFAASEAMTATQNDEARKYLNEARDLLDKATRNFPANALLNFRAFQGYVAVADTGRDLDTLPNHLIGSKTDSARARIHKVINHQFHLTPTAAERDIAAAESALRRARETVSEDDARYADIQFFAAEWARRNKRMAEAEKILRNFYEKRQTDQTARLALCRHLAMSSDPGRRDEAIQILEQPVRRTGQPGMRKLSLRELESQTLLDLTSLRVALYPTVDPSRRPPLMAQIDEGFAKVKAIAQANAIPVLRLEGLIDQLKGQNVEAVNTLTKAMSLLKTSDPGNPIRFNLMYQLATVERLAGQNRSAEKHLAELVERLDESESDPARVQLAECYLEDNSVNEAARHIAILDKHLNDPHSTRRLNAQEVLRLKVSLARHLNRDEDVQKMYGQLAEVTFEDKLIKAQIAGSLKNFDETIRLLKSMDEMKPNQPAIMTALYQAYSKNGPAGREMANRLIEDALKKNPNDPYWLAMKREREHPTPSQPDLGLWEMKALNGEPLFIEIIAGQHALAAKNYDEAILHARNADKIRPDDAATWDLYFQIYKEQQNWDMSGRAAEKLGQLDADHASGNMYRWTFYMSQGKYADAIRVAKILTVDRANFGQSWVLLAEAMMANGEFHEALQYYEAALARQTTNISAYKGMAVCYENLNQSERAQDILKQGANVFPDDPTLRELLLGYEQKSDPIAVVVKRRKMLEQGPEDSENFINLSTACVRAAERTFPVNPKQAKAFMDESLDVLVRGAGKFPEDMRLIRELANMLKQSSRFADGVKVIQGLCETPKWKGKFEPLLLLADFYARARKFDESEKAFRAAWATTQNVSVAIELRLAGFFHQQGKFKEALEVLKANEHDPRIVLQTLQTHIAARHTDLAKKGLEEALKADENNVDLLNLQAGVLIDTLDYVKAREVLAKIRKLDPANDVGRYFQAMVELRDPITADLDLARDNLATIVNRNPRNMQFKLLYVDALVRTNYLDLASVELDGAVRMDPFSRETRIRLLDMQIRLKKWPQFEQTVQFAELNPAISDAIWYRAHAYGLAAQEHFPEAIDHIKQAISMDKTNNPAFQRDYLIILMSAKKYDDIMQVTDDWMNVGHKEWWIYHLRGLARFGQGRKAEAIEQFNKGMKAADEMKLPDAWEQILTSVAEIDPDEAIKFVAPKIAEPRWRLQSVSLHMRKQDWKGAIGDLKELIQKRNALRRDERLSVIRFAGECYQSLGDNNKAEDFFAEWLRESPNDAACLNNYACLIAENPRRLEEARTLSLRAYSLGTKYNNPDPMINDTHGWILSQLPVPYANEGLSILEKLVDAHGEVPDAHYHLGITYLNRNRKVDAMAQFTAAMKVINDETTKTPAHAQLKLKIQAAMDKLNKTPATSAHH
jgi:tetratricopeptide (TPR) repeat protein